MPVEQLVRRLADNKQYYTMHGGMRPYGVSVLYAGWDKHLGFQLYLVSYKTFSFTPDPHHNFFLLFLIELTIPGLKEDLEKEIQEALSFFEMHM